MKFLRHAAFALTPVNVVRSFFQVGTGTYTKTLEHALRPSVSVSDWRFTLVIILFFMVGGYFLIVRDLFFVSVRFEMINVSNFLIIAHD